MSTSAANVVVYRCPTCNDVVILVPHGFPEPDEATIEQRAAEHATQHELVREIVERGRELNGRD